ncbi:hypothetical protein ACFWPK_12415 [Nocardia sp. NPDC058519]|uniref:hypothetical protein n=1 Tax=Nocardia sp. NPDC058519 TaxID=3346535 RepID=UPI003665A511
MGTDRGLLAAAPTEANTVAALSTAVDNLLADGIDREAVFAHLVRLHLVLWEADHEKSEDAVMDVTDRFVGWTTAEHKVVIRGMPNLAGLHPDSCWREAEMVEMGFTEDDMPRESVDMHPGMAESSRSDAPLPVFRSGRTRSVDEMDDDIYARIKQQAARR